MDPKSTKDKDDEEKSSNTPNPSTSTSRLLNRIEDLSSEITQDAVATTSKLTEKLTTVMKNLAEKFSPSTSTSCESSNAVPSTSSASATPQEEMKKRSSQSLRRNYRRSLPEDKEMGSESDSDMDQEVESEGTKSKKSKEEEHVDLSDSVSNSNDGTPQDPETSSTTTNETNDESSNESHASYTLPHTYPPDAIDEEDEEENDEPHSSGWISASSSSSSDNEMNVNEEDSSSSDSYLEDLEESVVEVRVPKINGVESEPNQEKIKRIAKKKYEIPQVLLKPKPLSQWNGPKELFRRELGYRNRSQCQGAELFRARFYGSLYSVERLELMKKLDGHTGCVNCLNFNYSGTKLMSGSDDLTIKIWNYGLGKEIVSFNSGHRSNVFQAKFLPLGADNLIVSCARDYQVRMIELDSTGKIFSSRQVASHRAPANKLSLSLENPHVFKSCGEDGVVFNIDIRKDKPDKILALRKSNGSKISLYSISGHPLNSNEFCVNGRDALVRIYDSRKLQFHSSSPNLNNGEPPLVDSDQNEPIKKFCPQHLGNDNHPGLHITSAVYNYNGKEILASYNDENIYLFDNSHSDMADCIKVYEGHRNNATVKGVNFFGDRSQFVVSGSDCGHIFIWDKETEAIVNFFRGDENGVVNCLEPHPLAPILATSGIDDDVKIWIPSNENSPKMGELASTVRKNIKKRNEDRHQYQAEGPDIISSIWNQIISHRMGEGAAPGDLEQEYGEDLREDCVIV